jgi:hypothetical protein
MRASSKLVFYVASLASRDQLCNYVIHRFFWGVGRGLSGTTLQNSSRTPVQVFKPRDTSRAEISPIAQGVRDRSRRVSNN